MTNKTGQLDVSACGEVTLYRLTLADGKETYTLVLPEEIHFTPVDGQLESHLEMIAKEIAECIEAAAQGFEETGADND